ncbi:MAG: hypothetical protein AAF376_09420 [Pseudomonadota bacterium]
METETLIPVGLTGGRYEAILTTSAETGIEAVHKGKVVALADVSDDAERPGDQRVRIDLPAQVLADGVQVVAMRSTATGAILDRVTLMAGSALDEDIRAELALMRDELEMLKRAFRRHCAETGQD